MTMTAEQWVETYRQTRPMATDDWRAGVCRQPRTEALTRRYIQANPSALITSLIVDVDHDDALLRVMSRETGAPVPSYVAQSPSGRAHVAYLLKAPVCRTDSARLEPMRFAARVEAGLVSALSGDLGYAGFLTKNPVHEHWDTFWASDHLYTLKELADHLPDHLPRTLPRRAAESSGLGRNVTLFNRVRLWSYRAVRAHWGGTVEAWEADTYAYALAVNQEFVVPLDASEVGHLAKSVSRWTWRNFTPKQFSKIQTERSRIATSAAAAVRTAKKTINDELIRSVAL
jgi:hypothetical protein